ncbi:MAG: T9SS type A sorting domain-containing protein, partial [Bacteroidales bacterium]
GIGHSAETRMIRTYQMSDIPVVNYPLDSLKKGYITQAAGLDFDPEPNTMKWMFSNRNNSNTLIQTPLNDNVSFVYNRQNSSISWNDKSSITRINIQDISGRLVKDYHTENSNQLNINSLNKGVFIVNCFRNSAIVASGKIIR